MKIEFRGIHAVRKRLADGTVRTHYYLGRYKGAAVLKGASGTPEFPASY
jgi:hypothetical protein